MKLCKPEFVERDAHQLTISVDFGDISDGSHNGTWPVKACFTVDVATGRIKDWPVGTEYCGYWKVVDRGNYIIWDKIGNTILTIESDYVPSFCQFCRDSYGDYINMSVNAHGEIAFFHQYFVREAIENILEERFLSENNLER